MGQRLNISIKFGKDRLANSYYHWSAYTLSALEMARDIFENYNKPENLLDYSIPEFKSLAVEMLQGTGAGFPENEKKYAETYFKEHNLDIELQDCVNRNEGILGISEAAMDETEQWAEGTVTLDLKTETAYFDVFWELDDFDEDDKKEIVKRKEEYKGTRAKFTMKNFKEIPFNKINDTYRYVYDLHLKKQYGCLTKDNKLINFIA